jgi:hypothetical protein
MKSWQIIVCNFLLAIAGVASAQTSQVLTRGGGVVPTVGSDASIPTAGSLNGATGTPVCKDGNGGIGTAVPCLGVSPFLGPRPYIDVTAYGAVGDAGAEQGHGTISAGSNLITVNTSTGTWQVGGGIRVVGAGPSGDRLLAKITAINGNIFTLDRTASTSVSGALVQDDDTLAIQSAMAAFCSAKTNANGGSIYFPPGNYQVSQPQAVNPNGIPFSPCNNMHILGGNSAIINGAAFVAAPQVSILSSCGSNPNAQPTFAVHYPAGGVTFENVAIAGCNMAVEISGSPVVHFKNAYLDGGFPGVNNASALHIVDTFWVYFDGGGLTATAGLPALLMTGDMASGGWAGVGNFYMNGALIAGGNVQFIQRGNANGSPSGHMVFRNVTQESGNGDFMSISVANGSTFYGFGPITMDEVQQSDNTSTAPTALINYNAAGTSLTGVHINDSTATGGNVAVKITAGKLDSYFITGCENSHACATSVTDASGLAIGSGTSQSVGGFDYSTQVPESGAWQRMNNMPVGTMNPRGFGPPLRFFQSGKQFAGYGIDSQYGYLFADPMVNGWNSALYENSAQDLQWAFAQNFPPTNVSAVPGTGGTFGSGIFYVYVASTTASSCADASFMSAASNVAGPYTVPTNGSLTVSWTPAVAGLVPIQGYCILTNSFAGINDGSMSSNIVLGASTSSAVITATPNASSGFMVGHLLAAHHFTPTAAIFNGAGTPPPIGAAPHSPACIVTTLCGGALALNPAVQDTFTRANGATLGPNWGINSGTAAISNNTAVSTVSASTVNDFYQGQTTPPDQFSQATLGAVPTVNTQVVAVSVRGVSTNTITEYAYRCVYANSTATREIMKITGGTTFTTLVSVSGSCTAGDVIRLEAVGITPVVLSAFLNGVLDLAYTDASSPFTSGSPGIQTYYSAGSSPSIAKWAGGGLEGNVGNSIFSRQNTWTKQQTVADLVDNGVSASAPNLCTDSNKKIISVGCGRGSSNVVYSTASASVNAGISAATMYTNAAATHFYRLSWVVDETVAGTSCVGNTGIVLKALYTDPNASAQTTFELGTLSIAGNGAVGNTIGRGTNVLLSKASQVIQYSATYAVGASCSVGPKFQIYPTLELIW